MKRMAKILAAVALLATGATSLGCFWFMSDEPRSYGLFND